MHVIPLAACAGLFATTFVQEGVALAAGAALIVKGTVGAPWVAFSLFAGMVCGDCAVYGLGAFARQSRWARRAISSIDLKTGEAWLSEHLLVAVAACHLVPWLLLPTFAAFGWFKVPFKRFALTSVGFNAVYAPLALFVLTRFGGVAWPYLTEHAWILGGAAALVLTAAIAFRWRRVLN